MSCFRREKGDEKPPYDDEGCQYAVKPSQLFSMNTDKDTTQYFEHGGVEGLAKILHTDLAGGLDPQATGLGSLEEHRRIYGTNTYKEVPPKSFFVLCWENLKDPVILLLVAAATISTVLGAAVPVMRSHGEWVEGVAIWIAVLVVVGVGAGNDYSKDLQFRKLNAIKDTILIKTLRGGERVLVKNTDLVVGDVVQLEAGDKVVADGLAITSMHLKLDEASLTGESDAMPKDREKDPWIRSGTTVAEGSGTMLVVAVGDSSEWGKLLALVGDAGSEDTPLQEKLQVLATYIGYVGLFTAVCSFAALLIKWCVYHQGFPLDQINNNGPVQFFLYAVTIVVVAVPEGLPLAVTIALAYSMRKMMRDNNFVRHLAACETMGGATAICSDKTGTLTENRMTVTEGWFAGEKLNHAPEPKELRPALVARLAANFALNGSAFLVQRADLPLQFVGNRTDCALLVLLKKWGMDYEQMRKDAAANTAEVYQFSSEKKMASILLREDGGRLRLYNKGAAEWVLRQCVSVSDANGESPLSEEQRQELLQVVVGMASRGLRCIAITHRDLPEHDPSRPADFFTDASNLDQQLTLDALVGIKDPVRVEVPDAVRVCQGAGITVRMVTGDNIHTARHIARECGILTEGGIALEGPDFRTMPAAELTPLLPRLQDKLTLVSLLKTEGEVVAVTGDGTNDAPALKESDVGLAMGIAGTEVAKEAADIVILDDNFSSIVKSVLWGRAVFQSIQKFLQFQLTVNVVAMIVSFVGSVVSGRIPLNVLQLLWVNLIMDTMGALALATEDPNPEVLKEKPHGRTEALITPRMWKHILVQSAYQMFWLFLIFYGLPEIMPQYAITDTCSFIQVGPDGNDPTACADTLVASGVDATTAATNCAIMANCGLPCGASTANTPLCPLYVPGAPPVPSNAAAALCNGNSSGCAASEAFNTQLSTVEAAATTAGDADFIRVDSLLFNVFIMCQIMNEINARRINDEYNVFENLHRSPIFLAVLAITAACQVVIMETPLGKVFKVQGLNGAEWGVSIVIGFGAYPTSVLARFAQRVVFGEGKLVDLSRLVSHRKHRHRSRTRTRTLSRQRDGDAQTRRASAERRSLSGGRRSLSNNRVFAEEALELPAAGGKAGAPALAPGKGHH